MANKIIELYKKAKNKEELRALQILASQGGKSGEQKEEAMERVLTGNYYQSVPQERGEPTPTGPARGYSSPTYDVNAGDNYFDIAQRVYGDQRMAYALIRANAYSSGGQRNLRPGMQLKLPVYQAGYNVSPDEAWAAGADIDDILESNRSIQPSDFSDRVVQLAGAGLSVTERPQVPGEHEYLGNSSMMNPNYLQQPELTTDYLGSLVPMNERGIDYTVEATRLYQGLAHSQATGDLSRLPINMSVAVALKAINELGVDPRTIYSLYGLVNNRFELSPNPILQGDTSGSSPVEVSYRSAYRWNKWYGKMAVPVSTGAGGIGGGGGGSSSGGYFGGFGGGDTQTTTQTSNRFPIKNTNSIYRRAMMGLIDWRI